MRAKEEKEKNVVQVFEETPFGHIKYTNEEFYINANGAARIYFGVANER